MKFAGTDSYVASDDLRVAVNAAIALQRPLLIKGEPGTGKTLLAHAIAQNLDMPLIILNVKSSMKAVEALYQYDTLTRLNDSRFGDSSRDVSNIEQSLKKLERDAETAQAASGRVRFGVRLRDPEDPRSSWVLPYN